MDLITAIIFILISLLTIIYGYFKYSFQYWKSRGVPHDEPTIPYGNIKGLGTVIRPINFVKNIYDRHKSSGSKICGFYSFVQPVAILLDLDLVKAVLVKDSAYFDERGTKFLFEF